METKSFTLIELLVVIVIIGILAGVIIVSTTSSISKASIAKVKVFENSIQNELGANMVSRWKLDEIVGTTTTPDAWGSNTGTLGDGVTTSTYPALKTEAECVTGKCMYFDGADYINVESNSSLILGTNSFTISFWMKSNTIVNFGGMLSSVNGSLDGIALYSEGTLNVLRCFIRSSDTAYNAGYSFYDINPFDGNWNFVVFIVDRELDLVNTYQNGIKSTYNLNISSAGNINSSNFALGKQINAYFNGSIDDARLYNMALSTSEIKQDYVAGLNSLLANNNISKEEYNQRLESLSINY